MRLDKNRYYTYIIGPSGNTLAEVDNSYPFYQWRLRRAINRAIAQQEEFEEIAAELKELTEQIKGFGV